jgi:hypothetical protein
MKIAQVVPLAESCLPKLYEGTERIASYLTERWYGSDMMWRCSPRAIPYRPELVPCSRTVRLDPAVRDMLPYHTTMLDEVVKRLDDFDVVHFHKLSALSR